MAVTRAKHGRLRRRLAGRWPITCAAALAPLVAACAGRVAPAGPATSPPAPAERVARAVSDAPAPGPAFLRHYCGACHADGKHKGDFAVDDLLREVAGDVPPDEARGALWAKALAQLASGDMPPEDAPQPAPAEHEALVAWADVHVFRTDCTSPDPGFVVARRLNRTEYRNTLRDLLGVELDVDAALPPDTLGRGFDNMAASLTMSPLLVERYLALAEQALEGSVYDPTRRYRQRRRLLADQAGPHPWARLLGAGKVLLRPGHDLSLPVNVPFPTRFRVAVDLQRAPGQSSDGDAVKLVLLVGREEQVAFDLPPGAPRTITAELTVKPGPRLLRALVRRTPTPGLSAQEDRARAALVDVVVSAVTLDGPLDVPGAGPAAGRPDGPPPALAQHRRWFAPELAPGMAALERLGPGRLTGPSARRPLAVPGAAPAPARQLAEAAARAILERFADRATRRPVPAEVVASLQRVAGQAWDDGASFVAGVRQGMRAVLVSPRFLYRAVPVAEHAGPGPQDIDAHSLAERLSYFLWSTLPDDELRASADAGTLAGELPAQVRRMLADPRAAALVENFGGQWLQFRKMDDVSPAWFVYKSYKPEVHGPAFRKETALLFEHILREDRPVLEFLTADYTFVNQALAEHYGIPDVVGPEFRRVSLQGLPRRGVLTHASTLTLTSRSTRTSPVMRGKWVLEVLLDAPPPPPPPDVPALPDDKDETRKQVKGTLRERLQDHRDSPSCAPCHARMDPLGFGLENFDGVGAWRDQDNGSPIDSAGELTTGERFSGPIELVEILAERKREQFVRGFATQLLVYALGRELRPADRCALDAVVARAGAADLALSGFVTGVVESTPFRAVQRRPLIGVRHTEEEHP